MVRRYFLLMVGVFACSTSAVLIKESHTQPMVLTALRLIVAVALLSPFLKGERDRHRGVFTREHLRRTRLPAAVLAVHLITWTLAARMTTAAQASMIVNMVPAAIPFFLHWIAAERINGAEIAGTALVLIGMAVLFVRDALSATGSAWGNGLCLISMLLFAWYLALGRRNRDFPTVWLYVGPVYAQAAAVCLLVALPWVADFDYHSAREWSLILGLALVPTLAGHSLLNGAMRRLRGQVVSLCNVSQFLFAGVMGYFLFGEIPPLAFYVATALAVAGVALVILAEPAAAASPSSPPA